MPRTGVPKYVKAYARKRNAAKKIQKAFRRYKTNKNFKKKVLSANLSYEPQQYYLTPIMTRTAVTQAPFSYDLTSLWWTNKPVDNPMPNPKFYRSSPKIRVQNMQLNFRVTANTDSYNKVSIMMVRHKRTEPIVAADIRHDDGTNLIPLLLNNDKPFLPTMTNTGSGTSTFNFQFGIAAVADPESLYNFTNPKVIDVLWKKHIMVMPPSKDNDDPTSNIRTYPTGFTFQKHFTKNIKLNEIWKYPTPPPESNNDDNPLFPYNNKCYSLICTSDSLQPNAGGGNHPIVDCFMRLSFKDLD